jgi:1-acyl-sn-glycerol-3-phosphate acyltransferase
MEGPLSWLWYETCYWASMAAMTLGFSLRMEGRRNVPRHGPVLLIANHQSFLDPVIVGLAARRHLCFLARKTLFRHPAFGPLIRSLNAIPVDQEGIGKEGLQSILHRLQEGDAVLVFPEGHRTKTGAVQPLRPGIHLLIKRVQAPIVPCGIAGAFDALPPSRALPRLSPFFLPRTGGDVAVFLGQPIPPERFAEMPREQVLLELHAELVAVSNRAERLRRKA